jgi:hypothetical protein
MNRASLVAFYIALQREAELLGLRGTAHVTRSMSDEEIVRLGRLLRSAIEHAKEVTDGTSKPGLDGIDLNAW